MAEAPAGVVTGRPELLLWSAATADGLAGARAAVLGRLEEPGASLTSVALELQREDHRAHREALVCCGPAEGAAALRRGRMLAAPGPARRRSLAFLLSGVGDHYPGMGRELYEREPVFREAVDRCCALLRAEGRDLREALYPASGGTRPGRDLRAMLRAEPPDQDELDSTALAQPAMFIVEYALAQLLGSWGVTPGAMVGYSLGEYVASCLAGVLSLEDALRLVAWRAERLEELPSGAMLAVSLSEEETRGWLRRDLDLAAVNSPIQCVVAGSPESVRDLERRLSEAGVAHRRVGSRHAFHSRTMERLAKELTAWVSANVRLRAPRIPYLSNVTGTWVTAAEAQESSYWARHLCRTVRLAPSLDVAWADPDRVMLELGPGQTLCTCARHHRACGRQRLALVQPTLPAAHEPGPDSAVLLASLGRLWAAGLNLDRGAAAESLTRSER